MPRDLIADEFAHVTHWVFDLDNTLYPPEADLFAQIEARIAEFVTGVIGGTAAEVTALCDSYFRNHGTTLTGLMAHHDMDPDPYLAHVHDIDLSALSPAPDLAAAIAALPGRKIVYTNGSRAHAERVVARRGLSGAFDALFGVEDAAYRPKPEAAAFAHLLPKAGVEDARAAMFEDDPRNLAVPHARGFRTVLVEGAAAVPGGTAAHIHHRTGDLTGFLCRIA